MNNLFKNEDHYQVHRFTVICKKWSQLKSY